jgi:sucrose-6-phosphate hydrolase SacC (GH32 family)
MERLRLGSTALDPVSVSDEVVLSDKLELRYALRELDLEIDFSGETPADTFGVEFFNDAGEYLRVGYVPATETLFTDRRHAGNTDFSGEFANGLHPAPCPAPEGKLELHIFLDVASIEVFAQDGKTVMTDIFFPGLPFSQFRLFSRGGTVQLTGGTSYPLQAIWRDTM